jgi:hypothetical protein
LYASVARFSLHSIWKFENSRNTEHTLRNKERNNNARGGEGRGGGKEADNLRKKKKTCF